MPRALHEQWRCPVCHAQRHTTPAREAFCLADGCDFTSMEPVRESLTNAMLAYPHLTPEQHRYDGMMRRNRGVAGC